MKKLTLIGLGAALAGYAVGCSVRFDDATLTFKCSADGDCGGGEYRCVNGAYCCKPDGAEVEHGCDGRDNDCNGQTDEGAGTIESCNGVDDDCDGMVDEGFDLTNDPRHCGSCERSCAGAESCVASVCMFRGEGNCADGVDNDGDMLTDCADPECNLLSCGTGCQCRALAKAEGNCNDGVDNDGDNATDCADDNCDGAGCGTSCICANMAKKETDCRDAMDNDGDMLTDCADPDCGGQLCAADPATLRCGGNGMCNCNDGGTVAETGARCRDRLDNDCNGKLDCAETGCDGLSCSPDGGTGCVCANLVAKETNCADRRDNDNDGFTDCGDALPDGGGDCPINTMCTYLSPGGMVKNGSCMADRTCK